MDLENYKTIFIAVSLILMVAAAYPTLSVLVQLPSTEERFSELWILGPNHTAEDYPFNITLNQSNSVFVGVANHLGVLSYYSIYVKFRNQTQSLPNATASEPSSLPPLYEFRTVIRDNETWEKRVDFTILDASSNNDTMQVNRLLIDGEIITLNSVANFDTERNGFYYELLFELWLYDPQMGSLTFNNRFVWNWLNITAPQ